MVAPELHPIFRSGFFSDAELISLLFPDGPLEAAQEDRMSSELVSCALFLVYASCSTCYLSVKEKETTNCFLSEKTFYIF
jgi:hypothetical protein